MISAVERPLSSYEPTPPQKEIQSILQHVTGLTVRVLPYVVPPEAGGSQTVAYMFKARSEETTGKMHDYVRELVMNIPQLNYDKLSLNITADPENRKNNSDWTCVSIRFSNVMGAPSSDEQALMVAQHIKGDVERRVKHEMGPANMPLADKIRRFQEMHGKGREFQDGYGQAKGK